MNKIFLIIILVLIFLILITKNVPITITGSAINNISLSIKEVTRGNITSFIYETIVNLTDFQNISVEFTNTGSTSYTARIEETIYIFNTTRLKLDPLAYYYDSSVFLAPGEKRYFRTVFKPPYVGTYYIKVKVTYGSKILKVWGSFYTVYYQPTPPRTVRIIPVPVGGGGVTYLPSEAGITELDLTYPKKVDFYPGEIKLINITTKNTGTVSLHNLKFYGSTTDPVNFEVNPKEIYELKPNESVIFLISIELPKTIPPRKYPFDFEIVGVEVKKGGSIELNVSSVIKPIKDEVYEKILNYEYLITNLNREILESSLKGLNTTLPEKYLDSARKNLQKAKDYFNREKYEDAKNLLFDVKKDLENVVFELANSAFMIYIAPAYSPFLILILIIAILIGLLFSIYLYKKRKKEGKPKIIREFTET